MKITTEEALAVKKVRDFAETLDEEGLDRDGLHIALYRVLELAETQLMNLKTNGAKHGTY